MAVLQEIRRRSRQVVAPIIGACVIGYFIYHTVQGDRGLIAYVRLNNEVTQAETKLAQVRDERVRLERRVSLLDPDSLDLDMLDESVRLTLNRVTSDEAVVFYER